VHLTGLGDFVGKYFHGFRSSSLVGLWSHNGGDDWGILDMSSSAIWKYPQVVWSFIDSKPLAAIAAVAGIFTVSAFVLESGFGIRPCPMCWWQRYVHWAITSIGFACLFPIAARLRRGRLALSG